MPVALPQVSPAVAGPAELQKLIGAVILGSDPNCVATRSKQQQRQTQLGSDPNITGQYPGGIETISRVTTQAVTKTVAASAYSMRATGQFLLELLEADAIVIAGRIFAEVTLEPEVDGNFSE